MPIRGIQQYIGPTLHEYLAGLPREAMLIDALDANSRWSAGQMLDTWPVDLLESSAVIEQEGARLEVYYNRFDPEHSVIEYLLLGCPQCPGFPLCLRGQSVCGLQLVLPLFAPEPKSEEERYACVRARGLQRRWRQLLEDACGAALRAAPRAQPDGPIGSVWVCLDADPGTTGEEFIGWLLGSRAPVAPGLGPPPQIMAQHRPGKRASAAIAPPTPGTSYRQTEMSASAFMGEIEEFVRGLRVWLECVD